MKIRNVVLAGCLVSALLAAPVLGATLRGEIVSVGTDRITVMSDGKTVTYLLPPTVAVQTPQKQTIEIGQLQSGQMVTLTVEDPKPAQAGQPAQPPAATTIRVEGDLEIDAE